MSDFTVIVTAEFKVYADNAPEAASHVLADLTGLQITPVALKTEVSTDD